MRRDRLDFYHDVLRDWAIGTYIAEDPSRLAALDLERAGFAARCARYRVRRPPRARDGDRLQRLDRPARASVSGEGRTDHGGARRSSPDRVGSAASICSKSAALSCSADGAALLIELCTTIVAVETWRRPNLMTMPDGSKVDLPRSYRTNITGSAILVLRWVAGACCRDPDFGDRRGGRAGPDPDLSPQACFDALAEQTAVMLFGWLRQLDVRDAAVTIPASEASAARRAMHGAPRSSKLRLIALLLGEFAPDQLKAYLTEIGGERDSYKVKDDSHRSPR